jgi:murein L,D-transpeptidase YafK
LTTIVRRSALACIAALSCTSVLADAPVFANAPAFADGSAFTNASVPANASPFANAPILANTPVLSRASVFANAPLFATVPAKADAVLVYKSERLLMLLKAGEVIAHFPISLGRNPVGPKTHEGDLRTPEGRYYLDWRNPDSRFYRSIHISYPSPRDLAHAHRAGMAPGGNVMIHGFPNDPDIAKVVWDDWTDGCIAVANDAMDKIWAAVDDGTVIVIRP